MIPSKPKRKTKMKTRHLGAKKSEIKRLRTVVNFNWFKSL